ncbi:MAG TPA: YggT family protein [Acidimicrobiales bacterium]
MSIICALLSLYILLLIIRAVLSFFPLRPDSGLIPVVRTLDIVIDPVLMPLRRVIPPAGMFDLSYLALFIIVEVVQSILCSGRLL